MALTINTNSIAMNAQRNLNTSQTGLATSIQRLSSGLRINSAQDDAAGLAISERINSQIRGMQVDLDEHIPPQLYIAVAELLAWLYRIESGTTDTLPIAQK